MIANNEPGESVSPARSSVRMPPDEIWDFVTRSHTGILTTLRRDGMPVALPVWFVCVDHVIYTRTRGKKLGRVRHDPRASFLAESGERWADLKAVHLTGRADVPELPPTLVAQLEDQHHEKYAAYTTARSAMPQATRAAYESGFAWVRFVPDERVLNWDNSRLSLGSR
jgi:Pyridoxamine 5'-phosphate oxidase